MIHPSNGARSYYRAYHLNCLHKVEILPSIRVLHELGYKLYGSMGTADYFKEHGVPVEGGWVVR